MSEVIDYVPENVRVLLVEDDEGDARLVTKVFEDIHGKTITVDWARSYQEGLELTLKCEHDVYVVDYILDTESGLELIRQASKVNKAKPYILLTGQGDERLAATSRRYGATDYLPKDDLLPALVMNSLNWCFGVVKERKDASKLIRSATLDGLTGLLRREYFQDRAEEEMDRARRYGQQLSLLFIDIDRFKDLNDTKGHAHGDEVLQQISDILLRNARKSDLVGRWGGEEFLIGLPSTDLVGAQIFAERIRASIAKEVGTTVSIGVAALNDKDTDLNDFVVRADAAMYEAKKSGRNNVVTAQDGVE